MLGLLSGSLARLRGLGSRTLFYIDHFGHHCYVMVFIDQEELEFLLDNRPWYVKGSNLSVERWSTHFRDMDMNLT